MSELMNMRRRNIRWELMTTASALAFFVSICDAGYVRADNDADHPTIWIELGAQSEQVSGFGSALDPPFTPELVAAGFQSPVKLQQALSQSIGGQSTVSFQPENSDWIFSISALYGRANGHKGTHEQTPGGPRKACIGSDCLHLTPQTAIFSEPHIINAESHAVLDFQVGSDVGLGLFNAGQSQFGFGMRFAQFASKQTLDLRADPDFYWATKVAQYDMHHHTYHVTSRAERSFRGLGPSVSWKASAPLFGNAGNGGIALDWGVNAAALFGRQKARGHNQTVGRYYKSKYIISRHRSVASRYVHHSGNPDRSRAVIVPNVGGFAGLSFRFPNAKVSLGYRADFFFGAMDGGIDTHKSEDIGFHGPFATISVGLP